MVWASFFFGAVLYVQADCVFCCESGNQDPPVFRVQVHNLLYSKSTFFSLWLANAVFQFSVWFAYWFESGRTFFSRNEINKCHVFCVSERSHRSMRDINDSDVDTLITIKGIVIRCSELIPDMQYHFWKSVETEWYFLWRICIGYAIQHWFFAPS